MPSSIAPPLDDLHLLDHLVVEAIALGLVDGLAHVVVVLAIEVVQLLVHDLALH